MNLLHSVIQVNYSIPMLIHIPLITFQEIQNPSHVHPFSTFNQSILLSP